MRSRSIDGVDMSTRPRIKMRISFLPQMSPENNFDIDPPIPTLYIVALPPHHYEEEYDEVTKKLLTAS